MAIFFKKLWRYVFPYRPLGADRHFSVDVIRGFAIFLMAVFHLSYDIYYFQIIHFDFFVPFWANFRVVIVSLFLLMAGVGIQKAYRQHVDWKKLHIRQAKLLACALLITVVSLLIFPDSWIYFGILHLIWVSGWFAVFFAPHAKTALVTGIGVVLLYHTTNWFHVGWLFDAAKPLLNLPHKTQDVARLIPWFGVVLIGIYLSERNLFGLRVPHHAVSNLLALMGRHSLSIYMTHQIPLFLLAGLVAFLFF